MAAWRLESLGFAQVYRYTPGKADWLANELPVEGQQAIGHMSLIWPNGMCRPAIWTKKLPTFVGVYRLLVGT
jgi:hypothetical protein